jgi:hypothetical protein
MYIRMHGYWNDDPCDRETPAYYVCKAAKCKFLPPPSLPFTHIFLPPLSLPHFSLFPSLLFLTKLNKRCV